MNTKNTYLMREYKSIHKFLDVCEQTPRDGSSTKPGDTWHGADSLEQAIQWARYGGWAPEYAVEFRRIFEDLVPKLRQFVDFKMERFHGTVGDEVNVAAYVMGEPDHMIDWVPQEEQVTKRALCLVIGHSIASSQSAESLFIRGQAIIGLVRALSLLGYELEIWSEETVGGDMFGHQNKSLPGYYSTLVRLHAAGEVMDESAVEFAVGNPAWLRRLLFAAQECEEPKVRQSFGFVRQGGYGSCVPIQHADYLNADLKLDLGRSWFSEKGNDRAEAGAKWVIAQLKELGVLEEDAEIDWEVS